MARNKEGLVLIIDVGPSMHSVLPEIEKVCALLVQKKLVYSKHDEVGVILFGTAETTNDLTKEVGGYEHVTVLRGIKVVDDDLVGALEHLPRGSCNGDFLDAIIVGMDMVIKKYAETNKGKKRLCLITNALCPIKAPYEGTKEDQVSTIVAQLKAHGMKMDSVIVRMKQDLDAKKKIMEENDFLLSLFSNKSSSKTTYVESPTSLMGAVRTRNIAPVTTFRGDLEISAKLKIKVWVYKKTVEERFPTLKMYSDKAPPTDKFAKHEVKIDYEYKHAQDQGRVVPPEQRIKGYRYGPQVVPISSAEWEAVKFKPEKGVKFLGFTDASNIMRHYYMKDANVFIAEPGNSKAILALSALARAMNDMNRVAIVRCVWRQGQGNVIIGVLTPNVSLKDNVADSFYFNVLPFAEDVREFQFPSFSNLPSSMLPNAEQQEAADNLVKMLNLAPSDAQESLMPELTPNPILQRYYHYLELKSKHKDAAVPPLDESLRRITDPDPALLSQNNTVIEEFRRCFELKENPKMKKSTKRLLRENPIGSDEGRGGRFSKTAEIPTVNETDTIGDINPVQDFEVMISRRDSPEWVNKAIEEMKKKIFHLVDNSFEGDTHQKALECLAALRNGCILEQEPKQFNDLLCNLYESSKRKDMQSFCDHLITRGIALITKAEAPDSDVLENEARSFMVELEPKGETIKHEPKDAKDIMSIYLGGKH
ncbi:unnamed protein product [Cuscuta campestris]|uniref:ATP-dependent DNA helicase 2 subunit KU80 n=1 Tax=Cuscuta campestris TaxID=132261 RepID=A0A484MR39_9ASTE|nr:unnamed protein product [Cuscuta campestris]